MAKHNKNKTWITIMAVMSATASVGVYASTVSTTNTMQQSTDTLLQGMKVMVQQTASNSQHFSSVLQKNEIDKKSIEQGIKDGKAIEQVVKDLSLGDGLSTSFACHNLDDKATVKVRHDISKVVSSTLLAEKSNTYALKPSQSASQRHATHLELYCNNHEVATGQCQFAETSIPNGDSDFSIGAERTRLTDAHSQAIYDFMTNLIPMSKSVQAECNTDMCKSLSMQEARYMALASVAGEAFTNSIARKTVNDTPLRLAKIERLEQDQNEIVGEFDGNTAQMGEGATNTPTTPATGTGANNGENANANGTSTTDPNNQNTNNATNSSGLGIAGGNGTTGTNTTITANTGTTNKTP